MQILSEFFFNEISKCAFYINLKQIKINNYLSFLYLNAKNII